LRSHDEVGPRKAGSDKQGLQKKAFRARIPPAKLKLTVARMKMMMGKPAAALKAAQGSSKVSAPMGEAKRIAGPAKMGNGNAFSLKGGVGALKSHFCKEKHKV